jgi:hypothetical protein
MANNVVKTSGNGFDRSREVRMMEVDVIDFTFVRKALGTVDVRRIKIYTAKPPVWMRRGQDRCCQTMSAAEVAPGKTLCVPKTLSGLIT